jgi:hypothetical protein
MPDGFRRFGATTIVENQLGVTTWMGDGKRVPACPEDTPAYRATALRLGYGSDTLAMCRDHEMLHNWLCHALGLRESLVMRALANGESAEGELLGLEEEAVMAVQRFARVVRAPLLGVGS